MLDEMLVTVLFIVLPTWVVVLSPLTFALLVASHWKVEAAPLVVKPMFTEFPLQTVFVEVLFITGLGFTVTVTD